MHRPNAVLSASSTLIENSERIMGGQTGRFFFNTTGNAVRIPRETAPRHPRRTGRGGTAAVLFRLIEAGVAANPPLPGESPPEWIARTTGPLPGARPLVVFVALRLVRLALAAAAAGLAAAGVAGVVAADAAASAVLLAAVPTALVVAAVAGPPASQEERGDGVRRVVMTGAGAALGVGVAWLAALTAVSVGGGAAAAAAAAAAPPVLAAAVAARLVGLPLGLLFWRQPLVQLFGESGRPPRPYALAVRAWVAAVLLVAVVAGGGMRAYALLGSLGPSTAGACAVSGGVSGAIAAAGAWLVAAAVAAGVPPPAAVAAALAERVVATHGWLLRSAPTALSLLADPGGMLTALVVAAGAYGAYAAYALTFPMDLLRAGGRPPAAYLTPVSAVLTHWGVFQSEREVEDAAIAAGVTAPGGVVAGRAMRMKRAPQLLESGSRLVSRRRVLADGLRTWAQPLAADAGTDAADSLSEMLFDVMTEEEAGEWGASGRDTSWLQALLSFPL
ncbi:hypothetical protein I4F81_000938 [Pyropia yezoensis]|uniref:Uncharacterized protein n=1 Tax=Pyropia yezoensis TaxID=2788 RepID=A0ACC3BK37_PYRYE|nr:hypothetical protein I4F81_000938 [Neopyropia yezoensis]